MALTALEVRLRARVPRIPRKRVRTKDVVISEMIWVCDSVGRTWNHYKFQKLKEKWLEAMLPREAGLTLGYEVSSVC